MDMNNKIATRESYGKALAELGMENEKIVVLDADLAGATKTEIFAKEFPERFFDIGIAEQDMIGTASRVCIKWKDTFCKYICSICSRKSI